MKALCLVLVFCLCLVPSAAAQAIRVNETPVFNIRSAPLVAPLGDAIRMDRFEVMEHELPFGVIKTNRELGQRFNSIRNTGFVQVAPEALPPLRTNEDTTYIGSFLGRSEEIKKLRGGIDVKWFDNTTTTLYFKSGLRWRVSSYPHTTMVLRVSRFTSLSFDYRFRNEHDIMSPVKRFLTKVLK